MPFFFACSSHKKSIRKISFLPASISREMEIFLQGSFLFPPPTPTASVFCAAAHIEKWQNIYILCRAWFRLCFGYKCRFSMARGGQMEVERIHRYRNCNMNFRSETTWHYLDDGIAAERKCKMTQVIYCTAFPPYTQSRSTSSLVIFLSKTIFHLQDTRKSCLTIKTRSCLQGVQSCNRFASASTRPSSKWSNFLCAPSKIDFGRCTKTSSNFIHFGALLMQNHASTVAGRWRTVNFILSFNGAFVS